jgi:hypothetical protein
VGVLLVLAQASLDDEAFLTKYKVKIHQRGQYNEYP